jgi:hypothetical protein
MTNTEDSARTEFYVEVTREARAAADRYGFEPNEDFGDNALVRSSGAMSAVFRVLDERTAKVQVEVVGLWKSHSLVEMDGPSFEKAFVTDPGYEFLEALDVALTDAFRRAERDS